jgi:LytS/YehU family sensor histidine kinase
MLPAAFVQACRRYDWTQWLYPGSKRVFTPAELDRAGRQPWPGMIDAYVLTNLAMLLALNYMDMPMRRAGFWMGVGLVATLPALQIARWLWVNPTRRRLNLACYGSALALVAATIALIKTGYRDDVKAALPLMIFCLVAVTSGWWVLTIFRVHQIEARLRELAEQDEALRLSTRLAAAQIQPHFLFNTLASLQHWVDTQDPRAGPMLRDFSTYLRATLPMFEHELHPLAAEVEMVRSYLAIMQSRLGERLSFSITVDPQPALQLPPGTLLTLVENAIRHGIEPQLAGGRITVEGRRVGELVSLSVQDDGAGLSPNAMDGVGLSNTRRRLRQAFGDAAVLQLADAHPGCITTLKLPVQ